MKQSSNFACFAITLVYLWLWVFIVSGYRQCVCFVCKLTSASDRTHFRDLSQGPAASSVTAALHLGVLTAELCGAAAVSQGGETGADTLV